MKMMLRVSVVWLIENVEADESAVVRTKWFIPWARGNRWCWTNFRFISLYFRQRKTPTIDQIHFHSTIQIGKEISNEEKLKNNKTKINFIGTSSPLSEMKHHCVCLCDERWQLFFCSEDSKRNARQSIAWHDIISHRNGQVNCEWIRLANVLLFCAWIRYTISMRILTLMGENNGKIILINNVKIQFSFVL